jgi:molybdenum cofactor cytidylyltransferase
MPEITAVLLAAGESKRMGQPKLLLPWGATSVLGQVLATFLAGLSHAGETDAEGDNGERIIVVTGSGSSLIDQEIERLQMSDRVRTVLNPAFSQDGMLVSIQTGLRASMQKRSPQPGSGLPPAVLIGLGDQPQVLQTTVRNLCEAYRTTGAHLVVPSHQNRRGHPWLIASPLWQALLELPEESTPRQFLSAYRSSIEYIPADETILQDLDTPEDYARQHP